ncbi:MAG: monovalent cation/H(+) antiporter subunit G [Deltaproteobacteria bacterium]|nr:monovalent cation/H(+) antiporter subunit G [Deltaproteobacteria bacterium]
MTSGAVILSAIFMLSGIFFFTAATIGILRFPDFFTRLHATGKSDTLAVLLCLIGLAIYEGISTTALKIVFIAVFMALAQPTATHAISKAALRRGVQPWMKGEKENDSSI